jgi:lipoprotein-releasing system permease protein
MLHSFTFHAIAAGVVVVLVAIALILRAPAVVSHLMFKYLRKRRIAWVSLIAVMLCTAMVIVVISVMGGWLRMFRESYHNITGDIVIGRQSLAGYPYYNEMIEQIRKLPEVAGAVPALRTYGLINIDGQIHEGVQVVGYPLEQMGPINQYRESLVRQYSDLKEILDDPKATPQEKSKVKERLAQPATFDHVYKDEVYKEIQPKMDPDTMPGLIVGASLVGLNKRSSEEIAKGESTYVKPEELDLYARWAQLTVMGVTDKQVSLDLARAKSERRFWIVDASRTKVWQYDAQTVFVAFDVLQDMLHMGQDKQTDAETGKEEIIPARTTDITIGLKPGADLYATRNKVEKIVNDVLAQHHVEFFRDPVTTRTWEQVNAKFIGAVEKEKILVTMLFAVISVVAIFLIFCIFYMIVVEKTRDIGIIKSVGATSNDVAGIFVGYGLAIGIVGGALGLLAGYLIIHNINELHAWVGRTFGFTMWDAETYAFDTIPNTMNPKETTVIVVVAILSALIGALLPAWIAARKNPVESLRWE